MSLPALKTHALFSSLPNYNQCSLKDFDLRYSDENQRKNSYHLHIQYII